MVRRPVLIIFTLALVGIASGVAFVGYSLFRLQQTVGMLEAQLNSHNTASQPVAQGITACAPACLDAIRTATTSSKIVAVPTPSPQLRQTSSQTSSASKGKEFFIPFGTASTESNEWVDITSSDTSIDPSNYGKIKRVTFEASMHIPVANGIMTARLFNVTDKHPVWFSEVSTGNGTSTLVTSPPLTLDGGNKVYRVQIQTTLQNLSFLDLARLRIIVE